MTMNKIAILSIRGVRLLPLIRASRNLITSASLKKDDHLFYTKPYKLHRLEESPEDTTNVTREEGLRCFREMSTIRRMENTASALYRDKMIRGFCHLYSGQEACCVGVEEAITKDDAVITAYRCHGWAYVRGIPLYNIFAELLGRSTGCSKGKGGSMHLYAKSKNFYGGQGIVGAEVPLGTGIALALRNQHKPNVCICLYGDGAANQGQVFESFNIAALWRLPIVYICENNKYGMGTSAERASADTAFYTRGDRIPGIWADGQDVITVREAVKFARKFALEHGPIIVELDTYRYVGHSVSDPGDSYRTRDEIDTVRKQRDPIQHFRQCLIQCELSTDDELTNIENNARLFVAGAAEKAKADPSFDDEAQLIEHVYSQPPPLYQPRLVDHYAKMK